MQMKRRATIVVFSGKIGAGKTTVAKDLVEHYGFDRVSFAGPLKEDVVSWGFDANDVYDRKPHPIRQLLIAYGMARRYHDPDYWVKRLADQLRERIATDSFGRPALYVCDDCRFSNEILLFERMKAEGHRVILVRLERQYDEEPKSALLDDESETALDTYTGWDLHLSAPSGRTDILLAAVVNKLNMEG